MVWISSSFITTCSPRAPDLVNWRGCWLLIVVIDWRCYCWSKSYSSGWWSWTISYWTRWYRLTINVPTNCCCCSSYESLSSFKQLMEAGLFLLCNSSLTILLISSVVFTGTGTMLPMLPPWLSILERKFYRSEDPYLEDQLLLLEVFRPPFVTNLKTSILKTTAVEALNTNSNRQTRILTDMRWNN